MTFQPTGDIMSLTKLLNLLSPSEGEVVECSNGNKLYVNADGVPLTYVQQWYQSPREYPIICVDTSYKWYTLYVIMPDDSIHKLYDLDALKADYERYVDNCYHPRYVSLLGEALGCGVCYATLNMLAGRWCIEIDEDESMMIDYDIDPKTLLNDN